MSTKIAGLIGLAICLLALSVPLVVAQGGFDGNGSIALTPVSATNFIGTSHTVTATVRGSNNELLEGKEVTFTVISGPNAGKTGTATSNPIGQATFTYTDTGLVSGVDTIKASFVNQGFTIISNDVTKEWKAIESIVLAPATAENFVGSSHTVTATVKDSNNQPIAGRTVTFTVISGPNAGKTGTATSNPIGQATFTYTGLVPGVDTIKASFVNNQGQTVESNYVTKTWKPIDNVIPEVPIGTIAGLTAMILAVPLYFGFLKFRHRKTIP